ncbi:MAG: glycosyltransferase family 4 protein [Kiritimatiellae bacterium]|nr:glycosyltransferase family 4 protein [Kiritimatiellia bacterium]
MKIAIDARWIFEELSGIGTYTRELIRHLALADRENSYILLFDSVQMLNRTERWAELEKAPNFDSRIVPYGPFSLRGQWGMRSRLRELGADVYHSTNYMIPLAAFPRHLHRRTRCVITIHDLIPLLFPEYTPRAKKTRLFPVYRRLMMQVGARADVILCPSASSRADVLRALAIPDQRHGRVIVIPEGVSPAFRQDPDARKNNRTILYVGRQDPYKNVTRLIEAFAALRKERVPEAELRIVGPHDPRYPEADQKARELGVTGAITWCGYLEEKDLVKAYQRADVFVLASDYEGFGLPALEAMACGTPVVCSNVTSLPEVAGDAALMVNPHDTRALADAIARVLTDPALAAELGRKGCEQAARFNWSRTAQETLAAYKLAIA